MVGRTKGFVSRVKERHQDVIVTRFFLLLLFLLLLLLLFASGGTRSHDFPADLASVLEDVRMINFEGKTAKKSHICISVRGNGSGA